MIITTFQCDLCFKKTGKGTTMIYETNKSIYDLIKTWDHLINSTITTTQVVKHICVECRKGINAAYE